MTATSFASTATRLRTPDRNLVVIWSLPDSNARATGSLSVMNGGERAVVTPGSGRVTARTEAEVGTDG